MKWLPFLRQLGDIAVFDLPTAVQLAGEPQTRVTAQLSRWIHNGKLVSLRRGLYAIGDVYRKTSLSPAQVANEVYRPSYLSCLWALSSYGVVPDAVPVFQSVTTRVTRRFTNPLGSFTYSSLKQSLFWGSVTRVIDGVSFAIAEPEKALLDLWHLSSGEWSHERMLGMRFQQVGLVDRARLDDYAARWQSPRIRRAAARWLQLMEDEAFEDIS
jgi:predicted transcriptional regulator of viral defense system